MAPVAAVYDRRVAMLHQSRQRITNPGAHRVAAAEQPLQAGSHRQPLQKNSC